MKNTYEIGSLVIDGFEIVEYLGYEEHKGDDNYHKLLSLDRGEYLSSAVCGPSTFPGTKAYTEAKRMWDLNKDLKLNSVNERTEILNNFVKEFDKYKDFDIVLKCFSGNVLILYYCTEVKDKIDVNAFKIEDNSYYKEFLTNYIEHKIKEILKEGW